MVFVGAGTAVASYLAIDLAMALGIAGIAIVGGAHQDRKRERRRRCLGHRQRVKVEALKPLSSLSL